MSFVCAIVQSIRGKGCKMGKMKVGLYCRVSTKEQTPENQLIDLRKYCQQRDWEIVQEFVDWGVSGSKEDREGLKALMECAERRKIDIVLVWRFDRFARSLMHLVNALAHFKALGVDFVSLGDNIDTTTPQGKLHFHMISAFAEFERDIIRERIMSGLNRARQRGIVFGRRRNKIDEQRIIELKSQGVSYRSIAKQLNISLSNVARVLFRNQVSKVTAVTVDG